jgi:hypothetical protein
MGFYDDTARALKRVDGVIARTDFKVLPPDLRPYLAFAAFYANAGQPAKARALMSRWETS